jgi:acyl-coenzyme A thioesterase PaaI-like protein
MQEDDTVQQRLPGVGALHPFKPDTDSSALAAKRQCSGLPPIASRRHARLNPNCVVCGAQNPGGLRLTFQEALDGVHAAWVPTEGWESFRGTVHGGIITTVLDEAMSKAVIACNWEALTVDLRIRFRGRVAPGESLRVHGWVVAKQRRKILTEATLVSSSGAERAHAWAAFLVPRA